MRGNGARLIDWLRDENNYTLTKDRTKLFLTIALLVTFIGDIVTTLIAINNGGHEANPLMKFVVDTGNPLPLILVKAVFIAIIIIYYNAIKKDEKHKHLANYVIISPTVITLIAVINNIYQILLLLH